MRDQSRRAVRPVVERMEARELLSGIMAVLASSPPSPGLPSLVHAAVGAGGSGGGGGGSGGGGNAGTGFSPLFGTGQPTPHELAREQFRAYFQGPVTVGPGRFSDQAKIIYIRGIGGANQFLHGDFQMALVVPNDPNAATTGEAYLQDKNNNSGGQIAYHLTAVPGAVDRLGRPNRLTFTNDPNIYSGIYYADTASGTVTIHYSKSSATVRFNGLVYTSGLTSPSRNSDLYSRGGRITPLT